MWEDIETQLGEEFLDKQSGIMGKENNKAGICWITFKENIEDNDIQKLISEFYNNNKDKISGMSFDQIVNAKEMVEAKNKAISYLKR